LRSARVVQTLKWERQDGQEDLHHPSHLRLSVRKRTWRPLLGGVAAKEALAAVEATALTTCSSGARISGRPIAFEGGPVVSGPDGEDRQAKRGRRESSQRKRKRRIQFRLIEKGEGETTRKKTTTGKTPVKKLKVKRETIKDLDVKGKGAVLKGGRIPPCGLRTGALPTP
jgi:hypothetical protein